MAGRTNMSRHVSKALERNDIGEQVKPRNIQAFALSLPQRTCGEQRERVARNLAKRRALQKPC